VTFLFTDIEGSTRLLERSGDAYPAILEAQRTIIGTAVEAAGGVVFGTEGDAVFAAFDRPSAGVQAAAAAQRALSHARWPAGDEVRVRMGLHTGEAMLVGDDYVGLEVHRAARIAAAAHGGQVLASAVAAAGADGVPGLSLRDLGLHRLKDLSRPERIAQLVVDDLAADFPPIRTLEATPNNLPVQLTSFIGRETELAEARTLLDRGRLVTLVGPGGTGKTRLALALAADIADRFPDGVRWVALEPVGDPALVPSAIADALELVDVSRPPLERVVAHLADKRVLLVLDNVEQVVRAAPAIAELVRRTTDTRVLATSRIALAVSGEQLYPVAPLAMPTPDGGASLAEIGASPAVQLFIERAMAVRPDFALAPETASAVANIVRGLDGLPLAIELAAARVRILSPSAIEIRLADRLALLATSARDVPERQQTIRGAIAWSHDLLSEPDRRLFARFGVFTGGAGFDQLERVCGPADELGGDVLEGLTSLVDQSLVRSSEDDHGDPRFAMLMTIADFARERLADLGEMPAIRERHARAYLELAESCATDLTAARRRAAIDRLADDHDNVRAALDWFVEARAGEEAERMVAALWRFWQFRGHLEEAAGRIEVVLAIDDGLDADRRPRRSRLAALDAAGGVAYWRGDYRAVHRYYARAVELAEDLADDRELARAYFNLSFAPSPDIDPQVQNWDVAFTSRSETLLERARSAAERAGDDLGVARADWQLGDLYLFHSRNADAAVVLARALAIFERLHDHYWLPWTRHLLGLAQVANGELDAAAAEFGLALRDFADAGDVTGITLLMSDYAELAWRRGDETRMWRLVDAWVSLARTSGTQLLLGAIPVDPRYGYFDLLRDQRDRFDALGQTAIGIDEAVAVALER
jgi:predicted ATPase/class 3 adenylate cyclase